MDDSGPYEIAEPRVITALETYSPSCEYKDHFLIAITNELRRAPNSTSEETR